MNFIEAIFNTLRNKALNALGVERDLMQLIQDRDISRIQSMMQNRDSYVAEAIKEYNPVTHDVMNRPDKPRKTRNLIKLRNFPGVDRNILMKWNCFSFWEIQSNGNRVLV